MDLIVLGAGPAYTDRPGSAGACYLILEGDTRILLDLGQGAFPRIFPEVQPEALDAVFVSHLHPDHFIDLVPLRHYLRWEFRPGRRVLVFGPDGLPDRLDALQGETGFTAAALDVERLEDGRSVGVGSLTVEARLVTHTAESYGFRVSMGDSPGLVYSGDCGRAEDLLPLLHPGDTLLAEVAFGPGPVEPAAMHLDGPAVGRVATEGAAGRVLLTHLMMNRDPDATVASVRREFDGPVEFVWPGSRIALRGAPAV